MQKLLGLFLGLFLIVSCSSKVDEADIQNLNGYWQIEKVSFPDGQEKTYKINETVDYFELHKDSALVGFRVKVIPQLDGNFLSNKIQEKFTIENKNDHYYLNYKTNFATWEEEILKLNQDVLQVKNENGIIYSYKRNTPIKL